MNDSAASEAGASLAGDGNFRPLVGDKIVVVNRAAYYRVPPIPSRAAKRSAASVSESCSTGVDGGNCAGRAIGGTLSISSALLSGKINDGATGRGCTGAAAGGALIGCSCGNTSGAAGVVLSTGRR